MRISFTVSPIDRQRLIPNDRVAWTADPDKIIAAVKRGHQVLDSIH
jgi:hypothetical protein